MIRLHQLNIFNNEHLYGPGNRLVIFLKGCSLHCKGCVNEELWPFDGGTLVESSDIEKIIFDNNLDGITLHGGEPLDHAEEIIVLVKSLKSRGKTVVLFTGYTKKELNLIQKRIWELSDIIVAGRFDITKRNVNLQFRGSTNQRVYSHKGKYHHYKVKDGKTVSIITIGNDGIIDVNGFLTEDIKKLVNND